MRAGAVREVFEAPVVTHRHRDVLRKSTAAGGGAPHWHFNLNFGSLPHGHGTKTNMRTRIIFQRKDRDPETGAWTGVGLAGPQVSLI